MLPPIFTTTKPTQFLCLLPLMPFHVHPHQMGVPTSVHSPVLPHQNPPFPTPARQLPTPAPVDASSRLLPRAGILTRMLLPSPSMLPAVPPTDQAPPVMFSSASCLSARCTSCRGFTKTCLALAHFVMPGAASSSMPIQSPFSPWLGKPS